MNKIVTDAAKQAERLKLLVQAATRSALDVIDTAVGQIKARMQVEPPPPSYPIKWDSEKQRRYVMAKLRKENNLPHTRTHEYINGFVQDRTDDSVTLSNPDPAAAIGGFYMGWQSNIHKGNWLSLTIEVDEVMSYVPEKIQEAVTKEAVAILQAD
jgi:hypothetical protein